MGEIWHFCMQLVHRKHECLSMQLQAEQVHEKGQCCQPINTELVNHASGNELLGMMAGATQIQYDIRKGNHSRRLVKASILGAVACSNFKCVWCTTDRLYSISLESVIYI